jgi:hypothetical protein
MTDKPNITLTIPEDSKAQKKLKHNACEMHAQTHRGWSEGADQLHLERGNHVGSTFLECKGGL